MRARARVVRRRHPARCAARGRDDYRERGGGGVHRDADRCPWLGVADAVQPRVRSPRRRSRAPDCVSTDGHQSARRRRRGQGGPYPSQGGVEHSPPSGTVRPLPSLTVVGRGSTTPTLAVRPSSCRRAGRRVGALPGEFAAAAGREVERGTAARLRDAASEAALAPRERWGGGGGGLAAFAVHPGTHCPNAVGWSSDFPVVRRAIGWRVRNRAAETRRTALR